MGVRENILAGLYDPPSDYPQAPPVPPVLKKTAGRLTEDELTALPQARRDHAALQKRYDEQVARHNRVYNERLRRFRDDLLAEHGVPADDPFGKEMYGLAYSRGHAGGFDETVTAFEELLPLWELYRDKK